MEDQEQEFLDRVKNFAKNNLLFVILFTLGLIFLIVGLIHLMTPKEEIQFQSAQNTNSSEKQSETMLVVDVSGAVLNPGVYDLSSDSRIKDAIIKAGGFSEEADRSYIASQINLAQKLTDGAKLYIPAKSDTTSVLGLQTVTSGKISINTAGASELDSLPGVGPVTSAKIIKGRPYMSLDELLSKKVVGAKVFEQIKELVNL